MSLLEIIEQEKKDCKNIALAKFLGNGGSGYVSKSDLIKELKFRKLEHTSLYEFVEKHIYTHTTADQWNAFCDTLANEKKQFIQRFEELV